MGCWNLLEDFAISFVAGVDGFVEVAEGRVFKAGGAVF